ncbi:hypothetical protein ANO11243_090900 [Dothideomycetidae sp. 11243]|nr:hypothetical protein ANO11243_090900 [fungal sp. No.11243]
MPSNRAAFLVKKNALLEVKPADYPTVGNNDLIIKVAAVAINPLDYLIPTGHSMIIPWMKFPFIIGADVAGEVVATGSSVSRFKLGDRVVGYAIGLDKRINRQAECGFQEYVVLRPDLTSPIPAGISYESAVVMPLGLSTAACALFMEENLGLPYPSLNPVAKNQTLLIWGGSTSVGCNAIQLAVAAGYEVISTASPRNHEMLRQLGAAQVFDYRSPTVVQDIIAAMKDRTCAGAISIGAGSYSACISVLGSVKGNKFIAQATIDVPPFPKGALDFPGFMIGAGSSMGKFINGSDLVANGVGAAIFRDFLPEALARGSFVPTPSPEVVGHGLEAIQGAMDKSQKGVSATKIVVTL